MRPATATLPPEAERQAFYLQHREDADRLLHQLATGWHADKELWRDLGFSQKSLDWLSLLISCQGHRSCSGTWRQPRTLPRSIRAQCTLARVHHQLRTGQTQTTTA